LARMADAAMHEFRLDESRLAPGLRNSIPLDSKGCRLLFALILAAKLPQLPLIARLILAIWWFVHFAAGAARTAFVDVLAKQGAVWNGFAEPVPASIFCFLFQFASNVFLALATTSF